jgi:PAS domain S-box-containing protein
MGQGGSFSFLSYIFSSRKDKDHVFECAQGKPNGSVLCFTIHSLFGVWNNNFHPVYLTLYRLIFQNLSFAFRSSRNSLLYIAFNSVIYFALLFSSSDFYNDEIRIPVFFGLISIISSLVFVSFKSGFIEIIKLNRDLLRSLVNKTENAIIITDIRGIILDMNPRAPEMFNYESHELIGQDFSILRCAALTEMEITDGLGELECHRFWNSESLLRRKDGTSFHSFISVGQASGKFRKFLIYRVRDTSASKAFEAELLKAKENAEEAAKVRSQFLATMSHEIRTPLNGVIGMTSLLDHTDLDKRQKEYVETIQRSGQSLMVLINDILDYSKLESGRMTTQFTDCSVSEAISEVYDLLRPHAEMKGLKLDVIIEYGLPELIQTDSSRLKQVLLNLVGNAIKFTDKGFVRVNCKVLSRHFDRVLFKISVIDSGIGIAADDQHLLFQPFSQVESANGRKFGGTGLGLAISNQIVQALGGEMTLESAEGRGSCFSFSINSKITEKNSKQAIADITGSPLFAERELLTDVRILVAEDNLINQNVLLYMLESWAFPQILFPMESK